MSTNLQDQSKALGVEATNMSPSPADQNQPLNPASMDEVTSLESVNKMNTLTKEEEKSLIKDEFENEEKRKEDIPIIKKVAVEQQKVVTEENEHLPSLDEKKEQLVENNIYSEIHKETNKINEQQKSEKINSQKSWELHPPTMDGEKKDIIKIDDKNENKDDTQLKNKIETNNQQIFSTPPPPSSSPPPFTLPNIPQPSIQIEKPSTPDSPSSINEQQQTTLSSDMQNNLKDNKEENLNNIPSSTLLNIDMKQQNDPIKNDIIQKQKAQKPEEDKGEKVGLVF